MNAPVSNKPRTNSRIRACKATRLLEGLEIMRDELGPLAVELIALLRNNGVTSNPDQDDLADRPGYYTH